MRTITGHHDGHGLNESIEITCDERTVGNASHEYVAAITPCFFEAECAPERVLQIQYQCGARREPDSTPGVTDAVLLAIVIDRYEGFQSGPFASPQGDEVLVHLRAALALMKARADERAARGVLGKNTK